MRARINIRQVLYTLLHISIWFGLVLLINSQGVNFRWGFFFRESSSLFVPLFYGIGLGALIFYLNANLLIPRYLGSEIKKKFWLQSVGLLLGLTFLESFIDIVYLIAQNLELSKEQLSKNTVTKLFLAALIPNLLCWMLSFAYRIPQDWLKAEKQKSVLEQDKLRSELNFLRAQLNPHFLFNGINSIYHMIGKDDDAAKQTLLQFSGLLRYQLYECNEKYIPLNKELEYISNYLNIEEVRKGEDADFQFALPDMTNVAEVNTCKIAPLLITPFLENAFKYLSDHSAKEYNFVVLNLEISDMGILEMNLKNSYSNKGIKSVSGSGGIGLENVKRRLTLLYPNGRHTLVMNKTEGVFSVILKIDLNEY